MLSERAAEHVAGALRAAGFEPMAEYEGDITERAAAVQGEVYPAFMRTSRVELSEFRRSETAGGRVFVTIVVRALGAKRGFSDAGELRRRAEAALGEIYFNSGMTIKSASCGEAARDMKLGRLVMLLEVCVGYVVGTEDM